MILANLSEVLVNFLKDLSFILKEKLVKFLLVSFYFNKIS